MSKKELLKSRLGMNMAESAGRTVSPDDRFTGFVPSEIANGEMALDRIMEDDEQPRKTFDDTALSELAENLRSHGVQQPIQLRWSSKHSKWMIVYGHRRYRAALLAGLETIPCTFTDEDIDESTLRVRQLVENCQRENLKAMELARGIDALGQLTGWSNGRIADELGMSKSSVGRYLDLLVLPEDLQVRVDSGELAFSVAAEVSRLKSASAQRRIGHEIADHKLSRDVAKARIRSAAESPEAKNRTRPVGRKRPTEILHQSANMVIYRSPDASEVELRSELKRVIRQLEVELSL